MNIGGGKSRQKNIQSTISNIHLRQTSPNANVKINTRNLQHNTRSKAEQNSMAAKGNYFTAGAET